MVDSYGQRCDEPAASSLWKGLEEVPSETLSECLVTKIGRSQSIVVGIMSSTYKNPVLASAEYIASKATLVKVDPIGVADTARKVTLPLALSCVRPFSTNHNYVYFYTLHIFAD